MRRIILKYGVFAILIIMSAGLLVILNRFEIRTKASVTLFLDSRKSCIAYMSNNESATISIGDTLAITQTTADGELRLIVKSITKEPNNMVLELDSTNKEKSIKQELKGNTCSSGFVFTGKIKLMELVLKQLRM